MQERTAKIAKLIRGRNERIIMAAKKPYRYPVPTAEELFFTGIGLLFLVVVILSEA